MKTVSCDICGATTRENTKWATTVIENYQLNALTMEPLCVESRDIDLCENCTERCLQWLHDNVKARDEVVGDD